MKLTDQAVGAIMMALQKGILEHTDITDVIKGFNMIETAEGLIVENPPILKVGTSTISANQDSQ